MTESRSTEQLCDWLKVNGWLDARVLPDGSVAALQRLLTTTGLFLGMTRYGYESRYCFADPALARQRFDELQSEDDVPAGWLARRPERPEDILAKSKPGYRGGDPSLASSWERGGGANGTP